MSPAKKKPSTLADVLAGVLRTSGIEERVEQAAVIPDWPQIVGPQIATVTEPQSIAADGTLFVYVTTNGWMMELSLMERDLLKLLNARIARTPVKKIRWLLKRD